MKALIVRSRVRKQSIGLQLDFNTTPVEVDEFTEYTGVKCDLPINAELKDYFDPFFLYYLVTITSVTARSNHRANKYMYAEKQRALHLIQWNSVITTTFVLFLKCRYSKGCRYSCNKV